MVLVAAAMASACFSPGNTEESHSQMAFGLSGGDFAGNSIRICGARLIPADSKYACDSVLPGDASSVAVPGPHYGEECPCFDFASDGTLKDPVTHEPVAVEGLCPSRDLPRAPWKFDYTIYTRQSCHGQVLNTPQNNFTCYDAKDLRSQEYPNASVEQLYPGENENHVLCATENASKTWDFESCAIETTAADELACQERYDCGCEYQYNQCSCGGLEAHDLEQGCYFEHGTCDIICASPP
jgi:hypothetical protein